MLAWFLPILTLIFITLKLTGVGAVAAWSWLWVLSPMLFGAGFIVAWLGIVVLWVALIKDTSV